MKEGPPTPPLSPEEALDWPGRSGTAGPVLAAVERRVRRRRQRRLAAASLALLAAAGATWFRPASPPAAEVIAAGATVTRPAVQELGEGSRIELNGDARVQVDFSPSVRRVTILQGEAHFEVAHDPLRPFVVVAGGVSVRAVGTAFSVRLAPRDVDVVVTDGRVAVDHAAVDPHVTPVAPLAFVSRGGAVAVRPADLAPEAPAPVVVAVTAAELADRLAWRVPRLEFNDTPLRDVIGLFHRHGGTTLRLAAPALGDLRISGVVRADNTAALFQLLRSDHGIEAEHRGGREFVLGRPH